MIGLGQVQTSYKPASVHHWVQLLLGLGLISGWRMSFSCLLQVGFQQRHGRELLCELKCKNPVNSINLPWFLQYYHLTLPSSIQQLLTRSQLQHHLGSCPCIHPRFFYTIDGGVCTVSNIYQSSSLLIFLGMQLGFFKTIFSISSSERPPDERIVICCSFAGPCLWRTQWQFH